MKHILIYLTISTMTVTISHAFVTHHRSLSAGTSSWTKTTTANTSYTNPIGSWNDPCAHGIPPCSVSVTHTRTMAAAIAAGDIGDVTALGDSDNDGCSRSQFDSVGWQWEKNGLLRRRRVVSQLVFACQRLYARFRLRREVSSSFQRELLERNRKGVRAMMMNPWFKIKKFSYVCLVPFLAFLFVKPRSALAAAMGVSSSTGAPKMMTQRELVANFSLFVALFVVLAMLHAVEIAITTLYPWKVRDFAEEEKDLNNGKQKGTFTILNEDIQRVLITILVTGTTCSIYATTIFSDVMGAAFGVRGEKYVPIVLTSLTLFFVELLPKSVGVYAAEKVARLIVPPVNLLANIVSPVGLTLSYLSKSLIQLCGMEVGGESNAVSDSELRLIVTGARDSGTIDHSEQEMIQGVLDLQTTRIRELMKPRVEIVACEDTWNVAQVLNVVRTSGYSRIPVYKGEIDNIVGIVLAKSVLDYFVNGVVSIKSRREIEKDNVYDDKKLESVSIDGSKDAYVKAYTGAELASRMNMNIREAGLIESCYFVPDTANGWSVLQEMRKRRVHVAIVVDEYGGTEGLASLEDIVEEVVGEIYDEDDTEDFYFAEDSILTQDDGSFLIRGDADLADCDTVLNLDLDDEILKEFSTVSGYLCSLSGEIPKEGDFVMASSGDAGNLGWYFEFIETDEKRIRQVRVSRLIGSSISESKILNKYGEASKDKNIEVEADEDFQDEFSEDPNLAVETFQQHDEAEDGVIFDKTGETEMSQEESDRIERIIQSNEFKREFVDNIGLVFDQELDDGRVPE
mmetsp:Transcript_4564/g.6141  ORF Transcript_4564/g.6141 Transcript_4564/m.6141 type:complete len:795 (-) Transcript_4564:51-2435(-)